MAPNEPFRWAIQMIHPEKFYCLGLVKDVFELPIGISNSNFSMGNIPISDKQRASIDSSLSFTISVILTNPNEALFDRKLQPKSAVGWRKASFADALLAEYCSHTEFHVNAVLHSNAFKGLLAANKILSN